MRVALVRGPQLSPYEMQTYAPLQKMGFELTAFTTEAPMFNEALEMPVVRLPSPSDRIQRSSGPLRTVREALAYRRGVANRMEGLEEALRDHDVFHPMETFNAFTAQSLDAARRWRKPVVVTVWENIPFLDLEPAFQKHRARVLREADAFVAVTERARVALQLEGAPADRIHVIPVGVDIGRFKPSRADPEIRRSLGVPEDAMLLLFAARLTWEKGLLDVLHAMKLLELEGRPGGDAFVVVMGAGDQRAQAEARVRALGMQDRVRFAGTVPYARMHAYFQAADAFVLGSIPIPRWQEQYGMVLVESMASGLPVLVAQSGSIPEVVGDTALLFQPNDALDCARGIERLADPEVRADLRARGRARAEALFDREKVAARFAELYRSLA